MKPNTQLDADIAAILGPSLNGQLDALCRCMLLAESAIDAAKERHPEHATALHDAFLALQPSDVILHSGPDRLFPLHCHELLERIAAGKDLCPGTDTELVGALSATSLEHPLDRAATYLYWRLFSKLFPTEAAAMRAELEPIAADCTDRDRARELEATLRRKLAVKTRGAKAAA